jgi:hypothetical protein
MEGEAFGKQSAFTGEGSMWLCASVLMLCSEHCAGVEIRDECLRRLNEGSRDPNATLVCMARRADVLIRSGTTALTLSSWLSYNQKGKLK